MNDSLNRIKNIDILEIGDVLLFSSRTKYISKKIKTNTNGNYSHAAIYIGGCGL